MWNPWLRWKRLASSANPRYADVWMSRAQSIIAENFLHVRQRVQTAAARAGRSADEVTLIAITKYVDVDLIRPLVEAGCLHFGESRPQAIWKRESAPG